MAQSLFTSPEVWSGGFYELALELGPRSDDRLRTALAALWQHPDLEGCYLDRNREPGDQNQVLPDCMDEGLHFLGVARLPNGSRVVCGSCVIREINNGSDWLDFYIPMGSLGTVYPSGGFPFDTQADMPGTWRDEIEDWLAGVGLFVTPLAEFRLGLIGFEVSGQTDAMEIATHGIPAERSNGYLWPSRSGVEYYRRTIKQ